MAIEVLPDSPSFVMSPRISFSHNLPKNDAVPIQHHIQSSNSSSPIDFDFCVFRDQDYSSSAADELFFDGKILPIQIKKRLPSPITAPPPPPPPPPPQIQEEKQNTKTSSFWGFKRSASLNCGSGYGRTLCPLPLLSRSNSTGSNSGGGAKPRSSLLNNQKREFLKLGCPNKPSSSSSASHQKPPLNKSGYSNRVKITPVLNVPTSNLFGLIFSSGKERGKKK